VPAGVLSVENESLPGGARVALLGELDLATAAVAEEGLRAAEAAAPHRLKLDLTGLTFMDSTGLRLVIAAAARAREAGRSLVVVRGPAAVQRVFEVTGVDERLEFVSAE
jgi:anti-sigma B factor antagonist